MSLVEFKVVLLGKEFIGKTSLVERFVYGSFAGENQYVPTIGAAFGAKKLEVKGRTVTLGLWDTAGSEKYNAISSIYYRNAHSAIVCYDITDAETFERAKFWISELKNYEQNCKVYLCGTKKDLVLNDSSRRRVDYHNVVDYADEIKAEVFETSSKTGEGVCEMFYKITENFINSTSGRKKNLDLTIETKKKKTCCEN